MSRLNKKAWNILRAEVEKCAAQDTLAGEVSARIVLNQLKLLRRQSGKPADEEELRQIICDVFPSFSKKALKQAAKANRPTGLLGKISQVSIALVSLSGLIWVINLPYPMIRRPIAKIAPILLLPSYISMDRSYRDAIASVEQADQLVNKATSKADFKLGAEKVKQAQKNLDNLPVWFLGYEPQFYCYFFSCTWRFTFDEFQTARANTGRMEAKIFQEQNAMTQLEKSESKAKAAKQNYKKASNPEAQQQAIENWQEAIDELATIPEATLAGKTAQIKLRAIERDFQQVSGLVFGSDRTNTMITAAQQFASGATQTCQNSPHTLSQWQACEKLWQEAIERLRTVKNDDPGYLQAQTLLVTYQSNLNRVEIYKQTESDAVNLLDQAETEINSLIADFPTNKERNLIASRLQAIINRLEKIQSGTTAYPKAQELLHSAQKKLNSL